MNVASPDATPSRVSPAVQWMHAFAYTPPSSVDAQARATSSDRHRDGAPWGDEDALPTGWHREDGFDAESEAPTVTVPTKRKRHGRSEEASNRSWSSTRGSYSEQDMLRRYSQAGPCASPSKKSRGPLRAPHPRSRRVMLDAVDIVCKKADSGSPSAHKTAYPSPPTSSRSTGDDAVHDGHSRAHMNAEPDERASPEPMLLLKTSKYFSSSLSSPTRSTLENVPFPTPPSSPAFENPQLGASFGEPVDGVVDESSQIPTWYSNTSLFDDLMIMLKRLKPILVQETVRDDPWKVLIAVRLLNVTTGKAAIPVFCKIISRWPTPQDLAHAPHDELVELLRPLGLYNKRAGWLQDVSQRFLEDQHASEDSRPSRFSDEPANYLSYPGVGPYALDSLRIFCAGDADTWQYVMPRDKELVRYLRWRWTVEQGKVWYPDGTGVIGDVDVPYLITLVDELAVHYDGAIGGEGYMYHFCNDLCEVLGRET